MEHTVRLRARGLRGMRGDRAVCVCVCAVSTYHGEKHCQHFLVDEILGEVEQDVSIVCLQSRAVGTQ